MAENIVIEKVWARETFKLAKTGAAYASLSNPSDHDITLLAASVDQSIASMVEIHTTEMVNGMMRMQELENGLTIKAGETAMLTPGGKHFMIMGLMGPLVADEEFELTLEFADDSHKTINVTVQDMRNRSASE